jgi:hypothetical protein
MFHTAAAAGRIEMIRAGICSAAALLMLSGTAAHAEDWCGFTAHMKAMIECGWSSASECESALGKGSVCFVDPDTARAIKHGAPVTRNKDAGHAG